MSTTLHLFRADRSQMLREMRDYHAAGDTAAADITHRLLERQHTRRWARVGGSLSDWDVIVLAVTDLWRRPT